MSNVFYTADSHFTHQLMIETRGFDSVAEHDEAIVENWNAVVRPGDQVWHAGDVGMGALSRFCHHVDRLHGHIHLIAGNHDKVAPIHKDAHKHQWAWMQVFDSVQAFAKRKIAGQTVIVNHYPYFGDHTDQDRYAEFRMRDEGHWLIHGHTHSDKALDGRQIHVGLDAWGLTPVHQDQIAAIIEERS